jgi:diguanylate cyclase (GGDEF)-like protein
VFVNGRKTIGVFISQIYEEYQDTLSKGISVRAKELGYNVAFFTNFGGFGQASYDVGERGIANLPNYEDLDGIIIAPDTMAIKSLDSYITKQIKKKSKCPVVSVRRKIDDYYNVLIDDNIVLEEVITHFVIEHGFTRLNFLAGPKNFPGAQRRVDTFKRILNEYSIPVEEERIYYGDYWKVEGYHAVEEWFSSSLERPQAIICANDFMAITVCNALEERGISVPDEIAVSGFDDIEDAAEYSPSITTARMPVFEMGIEAVDKIHRHTNGVDQPKNSYMKTTPIYRESCGCKKNWYQLSNERRKNHIITREVLKNAIVRNANMSTDLTGLTKLEEVNEKIRTYVYENVGFTNFYMCLKKDWDTFKEQDNLQQFDDEDMIMEVGCKDSIDYSRIKFVKKTLIPPQFVDDRPMIYYFTMLHHLENIFGYIAISFEGIQTYMMSYQAWLINVSNALENVRVHGELRRLVYKLEDMYIRDDLTGLYNRRGIESLGQKYLKQCVEEQLKLMTFTVDMDKLKYINDNFGHAKGDVALKVVADALQHAADDDEICMRFGGDEFMVIGLDYDDKKLSRFINKFIGALENFNQDPASEIHVYVSYGWNMLVPDERTLLEDCFLAADSRMYQQKYDKEAARIKANLITP